MSSPADALFKKGLFFVPLGGANEIGMNMNLYAYDDQWICVDFGVSFGDIAGVEVIAPDPAFLVDRKDKLLGLVLTHAHEDHIGAIPYLWQRLRCPIYATPFTEKLVRGKLKDAGILNQVTIHTVPLGSTLNLGPFGIEFINITHSILEPNALAITTPLGVIMHTGDWKLDDTPMVGEVTDKAALKAYGDKGVLAMVCDSTNVFEPTCSGSEQEVLDGLDKVFQTYTEERLVVTCFASNLARVNTIASLAHKHGRRCALIGRSLDRMVDAAQSVGYMTDLAPFLEIDQARKVPRKDVVYIVTGSQGEGRAALSRIAEGSYPNVHLDQGDVVVFSSRKIPGNERKIAELQNRLVDQGIEVIFPNRLLNFKLHVSGHPSQAELKEMYGLVRPQIAIPVHGDAVHLRAHEELALGLEIPDVLVPYNGSILRLAPNPDIVGEVPCQRLMLDGKEMIPESSPVLKERVRMAANGSAVVTLVVDAEQELVQEPQITLHGIINDTDVARGQRILKAVAKSIVAQFDEMPHKKRHVDDLVENVIDTAFRRSLSSLTAKKPVTAVHIVRI